MSFAARGLLFAVRVYQSFFSALMPSACKFYPSCSHYAAEALRVHGARRGSWLALKRIVRCHPFTRGGVDLVPEAGEAVSDPGSGADAINPSANGQRLKPVSSHALYGTAEAVPYKDLDYPHPEYPHPNFSETNLPRRLSGVSALGAAGAEKRQAEACPTGEAR